MRSKFIFGVLLLLLPMRIFAEETEGKKIIEAMIQNLRDQQNVTHYEMTIQRPRWTRTVDLKVWDNRADKKVFILIESPAKERGKTFLRLDYNLWMYLPDVEKAIKIPSSMMLQPWMGSDFSNDDLVKESSYIEDYTHKIQGRESHDGVKVTKIKLLPKPHAPVVWGSVVFWVREKPYLPVRQSFYSEKEDLIKELRFTVFKKIDNRLIPTVWTMNPVKKEGEQTILRMKDIDFLPKGSIDESVFTKRNLKHPQL